MVVESFTVVGMSCQHCVDAVIAEVAQLDGVSSVHVDLAAGALTVTSDAPVDPVALAEAIDEAGYAVAT